jgi:alpha-2-macroglobulin
MKRFIFFFLLVLPLFAIGQNSLKNIRQNSWQIFAYKVTANEATQFIKWDSIPVNQFIEATPAFVFQTDLFDEDKLAIGNYVLISTKEMNINAQLICISNLLALTINNKQQLQIDIRTKQGHFVNEAKVFVNNKEAAYNLQSKTWWVKNNKNDEAIVKIYAPGDTLFTQLEAKDDLPQSIAEQRKYNYTHSRIYKVLNWFPAAFKSIFSTNKIRYNRIGTTGYIIFNQPKYKPLDTVKFKGYVLDKKLHEYKKAVAVYFNYYDKGKNKEQLITTINPTPEGSYIAKFILADSIPVDISCTLVFKTQDKKEIIRERFKIEDYVLEEISTYTFRTEKEVYFKNDSLRFFASAKDANGLPVMDGSAILLLTTKKIHHFYRDTLFVTDTIYKKEIHLQVDGDTKFTLPADILPMADIMINAKLIFKNSNNELHEENETVEYKYFSREIIVTQEADSIKAVYIENGIATDKDGEMEMNEDTAVAIHFPCTFKIDPVAKDYSFYTTEENQKNILAENYEVPENYRLYLKRISNRDTLGFVLDNPNKIPVYFTIFDGKKIVATDKQSGEQVTWKKVLGNHRQSFKVRWQYIWAGKENYGEENIGLLYKLLNINIAANTIIFPSQKNSIVIDVKDYKGNPAAGVNLTAVSYNNQFKKDIRVTEPPYLAKYTRRQYLQRQGFENDGSISLNKNYQLGKNQAWINKFHLDTMVYYKLLFPQAGNYDAVTLIEKVIPQISVAVVDKGIPQEIYLLYINRELVYYNGVTDSMKYAFQIHPGYIQMGIRLKDKFIEIDSFYIQPNYKHDVSFDINHLPDYSSVTPATKFWTYVEMSLIEQSFWQMENNFPNNNAFVWQGNRLIKLYGNKEHLAGPFRQSTIQFFNPGNFDIAFTFEPGYRYSLSKQITRLEKRSIFPKKNNKNFLPTFATTRMMLGDTLVAPPEIIYLPIKRDSFLLTTNDFEHNEYADKKAGMADLQLSIQKDTVIKYVILVPHNGLIKPLVLNYYHKINNIQPGIYSLLTVNKNFYTATLNNVLLVGDGTNCINTAQLEFVANNDFINQLIEEAVESLINKKDESPAYKEPEKTYKATDSTIYAITGGATVTGKIADNKGRNPIPFVLVNLKGYKRAVVSDTAGKFELNNLKPGKYILEVSAVGYEKTEVTINCVAYDTIKVNIVLKVSNQSLQEVVVVGYGSVKRKDLTGSISVIRTEELTSTLLQGKVAGLSVTSQHGSPGSDAFIQIRGISSFAGNNKPLYVIDGIMYDEIPKNFNSENASEVNFLTDDAGVALFGSRATNGVVVINTKTKTLRKDFRDYAFWQPNLLTDKNGHISFDVNYPDNITGWKTFVVAMDKKHRTGKASILTQSYKPIVAQLSVPRFLVEGDSTAIIGKIINYTADKYTINTQFSSNISAASVQQNQLDPNEASVSEATAVAVGNDTIPISFSVETTTGFKDGEERKIPVYKKGTDEAIGDFWTLKNDTSFSFTASPYTSEVTIYAQNNTLDMLLEELNHLRKYPYYCMEQVASKLTGFAMERKIREQLKQPFKNQAAMDKLLQKLQKAQLFDGGWSWWENGKANFYITNYITNALLSLREEPLVESNIRNAFLYLQNQLLFLNTTELLTALATLSEGRHEMDYESWFNKISLDSLSQHHQWLWVKIRQQQKLNYQTALQKLVDKKINTVLGGLHWGIENYSWYSNETATTIIAYNVIKNEEKFKNLLPAIIQYFLEKRSSGRWVNTVASAIIVSTILPAILEQQTGFAKSAMLKITGDTSFVINSLPYQLKMNADIKNFNVSKDGGGMVYFTAYQNIFNPKPSPVLDKFIINTIFKKNNQVITSIKTGEKITLQVSVNALKDAEYVMIQVPIPAGCTYAANKNPDWNMYSEFYKDRVILFAASLPKGIHQFEIELEPRYKGNYNINPAKIELMYFPIFFGRNEMKKIKIFK